MYFVITYDEEWDVQVHVSSLCGSLGCSVLLLVCVLIILLSYAEYNDL